MTVEKKLADMINRSTGPVVPVLIEALDEIRELRVELTHAGHLLRGEPDMAERRRMVFEASIALLARRTGALGLVWIADTAAALVDEVERAAAKPPAPVGDCENCVHYGEFMDEGSPCYECGPKAVNFKRRREGDR